MEILDIEEMEKNIAVCAAIYDSCKRNVRDYAQRGLLEQAASWAWLAAFSASHGGFIGSLADPELEDQLLEIGRTLPAVPRRCRTDERLRYLHVLTEIFEVGGHTRLCQRWIESDSQRHRHSVVLTAQVYPVPKAFKDAVSNLGGELTVFDPTTSLLNRAAKLRSIACEQADVVVLHMHPNDVMPILAFAVSDTPPVVYLNHAWHLFWLGGSVADLVLDLTGPAKALTKQFRGIENTTYLPIPLQSPDPMEELTECSSNNARNGALAAFGIPENAMVFLTIGAAYKYNPIGDYGFLAAASVILTRLPHAYILAVGPREEGDWSSVAASTGGRLKAFGNRPDLQEFYSMADVYLEGIPFGSCTALLEVGLRGIPCVRSPSTSTKVFCSDSESLSNLVSPADIDSYIAEALRLGTSSIAERRREGAALRKSIIEHHCGEAWLHHLSTAEALIPERHSVQTRNVQPMSREESGFMMSFCRAAFRISGWGDFLRRLSSAAGNRMLCIEFKFDDELRRRVAVVSKRGSTRRPGRTSELYDFLNVEAHLAYERQDFWRVRKNWVACLILAPFERRNLSLTLRALCPPAGPKMIRFLRAVRPRVSRS